MKNNCPHENPWEYIVKKQDFGGYTILLWCPDCGAFRDGDGEWELPKESPDEK